MKEKQKPCPVCSGTDILFYEGACEEDNIEGLRCRGCDIKLEYAGYAGGEIKEKWNNLPRLDEKRKAEIALEMMGEFEEQDQRQDYSFNCGEMIGEFNHWLWDLKEKNEGGIK